MHSTRKSRFAYDLSMIPTNAQCPGGGRSLHARPFSFAGYEDALTVIIGWYSRSTR